MGFNIKNYIDMKSLLIALTSVVGFYVILLIYSLFFGSQILLDAQEQLARKTVFISDFDPPITAQIVDKHSASTVPNRNSEGIGMLEQKKHSIEEIPGLFESHQIGHLPMIRGSDGLTPFEAYKKKLDVDAGIPRLAIAFQDIGLSDQMSYRAIEKLPEEISLIVSPYSRSLDRTQKLISMAGHEMWLSVPAEDIDYPMSQPGKHGLLSRSSTIYNREKLHWAMSQVHGYAGVAIYLDQAFMHARNVIFAIGEEVFARGLGYLDLNPASSYGLDMVAAKANAPYLLNLLEDRDVIFEDVADSILDYTKAKGTAVVVLPPTPVNIDFIVTWSENITKAGVNLVPLSAIYLTSSNEKMEMAIDRSLEDFVVPTTLKQNNSKE